jgi:hypothetical protein
MELETQALLDTRGASEFLREKRGVRVSSATLDTKRTRGGGPKFRRFGTRIVYHPADLLDWAEARLSAPAGSTAEHDARSSPPDAPASERQARTALPRPDKDGDEIPLSRRRVPSDFKAGEAAKKATA